MEQRYKKLLKPCVLSNGLVLKNRICYSNGQQHLLTGPDQAPNEALIDDVAVFARSGACLMTVGHFGKLGGGGGVVQISETSEIRTGLSTVDDCKEEAPGSAARFNYEDSRTFNIVGQMAQVAHFYDTRILVKMGTAFPKGVCLNGVEETDEMFLFPLPKQDWRFDSKVMGMLLPGGAAPKERKQAPTMNELKQKLASKEQIAEAIKITADMCLRYKNAGFDGVSIRGDRWGLNASTNIRDDEYGGNIEGRGRFQFELFQYIKKTCGADFLIEVVMPGESPHGHDGQLPEGYTLDEFVRFMVMVEPYIDIVEIRENMGIFYQCLGYNSELHKHKSLEYADSLRKAGFKKTIAVNGGYNDPDEMEQILENGVVDLISTVRTFRAEPEFIEKLRSNGKQKPAPCIRCNRCHGSYEGVCGCSINPKDALNHRIPLIVKPSAKRKKVAVIGGGMIGMRAACLASERGHEVVLFEQDQVLGGKAAYYSYMYPQTWPIKRYLEWLIDELKRSGVSDVRLGNKPEPQSLIREGFDAIIACTGSREKTPPIPGADGKGVWKNEDIYYGNVVPGSKVVIVGGGDVATETAMYLAGTGREVTVLTRQEVLMPKHRRHIYGPHMGNYVYIPELGYGQVGAAWTKYDNLKPIYGVQVRSISSKEVSYEINGEMKAIEADTVVVSGGFLPSAEEALHYCECTNEFYMAGDVISSCSNIMLGNRSALARAYTL